MSDGCWVQFWDDDGCAGATLRFDTNDGTLFVNDLDDYTQSDGRQEGNEPDSLRTGSRSWLVVYKDKNYEGTTAMFGPNTQVNDLGKYGVGGNISSFKLYDTRPSWFNSSVTGAPTAIETGDGELSASTVNDFFRTAVGSALYLLPGPGVGSALSTLVRGLWPDTTNPDQVWACYQNYLNQSIAGVYWQLTYESLNDILTSLYKAAKDFINTPDTDKTFKVDNFRNLYDLVNNAESFFIDTAAPEKRYSFIAPFAGLRLATLRENLDHYDYYYGSPPSPEVSAQLTEEIQRSIALYQQLMTDARERILARREGQIIWDGPYLVDLYLGKRMVVYENDAQDNRQRYVDGVLNALALTLDTHNAIGQLWSYFNPAVTATVQPPTLLYATGPHGYYWYGTPQFSKIDYAGRVSALKLWEYNGRVGALELFVDGVSLGRVGKDEGTVKTLDLPEGERMDSAEGETTATGLGFSTNWDNHIYAGYVGTDPNTHYTVTPLPGTLDTRLIGMSGFLGEGSSASPSSNLKAITLHWACELSITDDNA